MPEPELNDFVLDSFAILSLLNDDRGAGRVEELLRDARSGTVTLGMSLINLGEAAYIVQRRHGEEDVRTLLALLNTLPVEYFAADYERVLTAAYFKAEYPIAYADAFAAALAAELQAVLITGDPEFKALEEKIRIEWLPLGDEQG